MGTTSNATSTGATLRANPSSNNTQATAQGRTTTTQGTFNRVIAKGLRPAQGRQRLAQFQAQGRDVTFDQGSGRIIETVKFNRTIETRNDQGKLQSRQTFTAQGGQANLTKIETFRNGQLLQTRHRKFKNKQFRGERTVTASGSVIRNTKGLIPRKPEAGELPQARRNIAARQRIQTLNQESIAAQKQQARSQFLVRSAQNFQSFSPKQNAGQVNNAFTPSNANFQTTTGQFIESPAPSIPLSQAETKAATVVGTVASFNPLLKSELTKSAFAKSLGERAGGVAQQQFKSIEQKRTDAALIGVKAGAIAIGGGGLVAGGVVGGATLLGAGKDLAIVASAKTALGLGTKAISDATAKSISPLAKEEGFNIARQKGRQAKEEAIGQENIFVRFGAAFLPAAFPESSNVETQFRTTTRAELKVQFPEASEQQINLALRAAKKSKTISETPKPAQVILNELAGEKVGRRFIGALSGKGVSLGDNALKRGLKGFGIGALGVAPGGFAEASFEEATEQKLRGEQFNIPRIVKQGAKGAAVAAVLGGTITGAEASLTTAGKGLSKGTQTAVNIVDIGEKPGDLLADFSEGISRRTGARVFTPSIVTSTTTNQQGKVKTSARLQSIDTSIKTPSITPTSTPSKSSIKSVSFLPSTTTKNVNPSVPSINFIKFTQPSAKTPIRNPIITPSNIFIPSIVPTSTTTETITSSVTVPTITNTPTTTTSSTPIPVVVSDRFTPPIIQPSDGGAGSFKFKMPKFTRQKGGFAPSLAGLATGRTQKTAPKFTSGIGIRLPTLQTDTRSSVSGVFSRSRKKKSKKKKKKKKGGKK